MEKLFFWMLEVSLVNSFLIYKEAHHLSEERHLRYSNKLVAHLVGNISNRKAKRGRPSGHDDTERLNKTPHFTDKTPRGRNKNFLACSSNGNRKTRVLFCETCQRKPGLHPGDYFKKYHTMVNYKE